MKSVKDLIFENNQHRNSDASSLQRIMFILKLQNYVITIVLIMNVSK